MRIGISQINTIAGDLAHTADRMAHISQVAAEREVDLLVFPYTVLTGPVPVDISEQQAFLSDLTETLVDLAQRVSCPCLVPAVMAVGEEPTIEVFRLQDGLIESLRRGSAHSFGHGLGLFSINEEDALVRCDVKGTSLGFAFTYEDLDRWRDEQDAPRIICYLSCYGYALDDASSALGSALVEGRYLEDVQQTGAWLVGIGPLGGYGTQVFGGSSFVLAPDGRLVGSSPAFEEDLLVAEVGEELPSDGLELQEEVYDERYHLWQALVLGLHDYVWKLGLKDVVIGLDGSLASMLLAVVATDALGPTHVHATACMPRACPRSQDVLQLARSLHIGLREAPAPDTSDEQLVRDVAEAHLAALAREVGGIVLSSADKTALALEWKHASSSAACLAPLGDVYRIDVLDVARMRNTISAVFPSLQLLVTDVPDIGIEVHEWETEVLLEQIDGVLAGHVEGARGLNELIADDEEIAVATLKALRDCEAFRAVGPACLMMSTRTLRDARMLKGFAWRDHVRDAAQPWSDFLMRTIRPDKSDEKRKGADTQPSESPLGSKDFAEALALLRDFAQNAEGEWFSPFSDN